MMPASERKEDHYKRFCLQRILLLLLFIPGAISFVQGQTISIDSFPFPKFGKIYTYNSSSSPERIIIMISGDGGWKYGVPQFAREFAKTNALVVGVDILSYYKHLRHLETDCYMVSADFVELGTIMEEKYKFREYTPAVLMGYSSGATLVYGILAQSRQGTYKGGISLGFCPDIDLPKMLCQIYGLKGNELVKGKSQVFLPDERMANEWIVLQGQKDKICDFRTIETFVNKTNNAGIVTLPEGGHDFSRWAEFMPQWKSAYNKILESYDSVQGVNDRDLKEERIQSVITMGKQGNNGDLIALFFSGDGGWYSFEQSIADRLAEEGISTIGIDIKKYLWNRKSPETVSSDISLLLKSFSKEWGRSKIIILGYSQGAEIIPFIFNRLPEKQKFATSSLVMLSPGETTDFEIHVTNMMGLGNRENTFDVIAEISKISNTRQICIFGDNENPKVRDALQGSKVESVTVPGDHHYKNSTSVIVKVLKDRKVF